MNVGTLIRLAAGFCVGFGSASALVQAPRRQLEPSGERNLPILCYFDDEMRIGLDRGAYADNVAMFDHPRSMFLTNRRFTSPLAVRP